MARNTEVFRHVWLAFSEGRADEIAEHLHPAVEWRAAMLDEVFRGPAAARRWIAALSHEWKSLTVVVDEVRELGDDCVVALGTAIGFDYGGDQRLERPFAWLTEYIGGRIMRSLVFADAGEADAYVASRGRVAA
jgi:ketosteroid isomerase-like protein